MKSLLLGSFSLLTLIAASAALSPPAVAQSTLYSTEAIASAACGADEVVWVNLDRSRLYHKGQADYAKGANGGYGCLKQVSSKYRPGQSQ